MTPSLPNDVAAPCAAVNAPATSLSLPRRTRCTDAHAPALMGAASQTSWQRHRSAARASAALRHHRRHRIVNGAATGVVIMAHQAASLPPSWQNMARLSAHALLLS